MSILDERQEYLKNPYFTGHQYGDFTPFYIGITICSAIGAFLFTLNIIFCWCSPWRGYWRNRHTGNRWIQTIWTNTPHKNPPLDLSELETGINSNAILNKKQIFEEYHQESEPGPQENQEYMELHKRESEI